MEAEECFSFYIGFMETLHGPDSLKVGQCYYLLGQFYDEQSVSLSTKAESEEHETLSTVASLSSAESQSSAAMINHMFSKAILCYNKASLIFQNHPRAVGDCLYSTALLYKHHMKLASVSASSLPSQ